MRTNPMHYAMIVVDVVGFSRRDDRFQLRIRGALNDILADAFADSGIPAEQVVTEDRGDGKLMLISSEVSAYRLIDPLVDRITVGLRQHNTASSEDGRIRLRMVLHQGMVQRDGSGWAGSDLNSAFRLVDSRPLRAAVEANPEAQLLFIVSDSIYQSIVRHAHGAIEPHTYRRVRVKNKEVSTTAWIHIPKGAHRVSDGAQPTPPSASEGGGATFGTVIALGDVVGRDKIIGESR